MNSALDRPEVSGLLSHWTLQPVAVVLVVALAVWYLRGLRAVEQAWPLRRTLTFVLGLFLLLWLTCGFPQVYADSLFWVWTSQVLLLWLVVPIVVLGGKPVQLAQAVSGPGNRIDKVLESRTVRVLGNPLVGPALVPVLSFGLFFGPVAGWAISSAPAGWVLQLLLLAIGSVMAIPLVGLDETADSLAVGFSAAIGSLELVIDALPGVVLRLSTHVVTGYFDHRASWGWSPQPHRDQEIAGAILWCIAELIDLPFLVLVFGRWLRADQRDAARIDAVLAAERAARRGLEPEAPDEGNPPDETGAIPADRDAPWWLSDPAMVERLRRQR